MGCGRRIFETIAELFSGFCTGLSWESWFLHLMILAFCIATFHGEAAFFIGIVFDLGFLGFSDELQLKDNSQGFSCDKDPAPGEFQGQKYDYVQRNICIDHIAAPIEQGRCPRPYCGINVDSAENIKAIVEVQDANVGISYHFDC